MPHKRPDKKEFYPDGVACALCGLPIPDWLVSSSHPLFGTVDHIIPVSVKGQNVPSNRQPAHRVCNQTKGNDLEGEVVRADCLRAAIRAFSQITIPKSRRYKRARDLVSQAAQR